MASTTYYLEMGQAPAKALFQSHSVINSTIGLKWLPEDDAKARQAFKTLRIRPRAIERWTPINGGERISARCTHDAERKLYAAGLVCREMLLD